MLLGKWISVAGQKFIVHYYIPLKLFYKLKKRNAKIKPGDWNCYEFKAQRWSIMSEASDFPPSTLGSMFGDARIWTVGLRMAYTWRIKSIGVSNLIWTCTHEWPQMRVFKELQLQAIVPIVELFVQRCHHACDNRKNPNDNDNNLNGNDDHNLPSSHL